MRKKVGFVGDAGQYVTEHEYQADLQRLQNLRPIDDEFIRCSFKDNISLAELVLRIITGKQDLVITDCQTQKDMKRINMLRDCEQVYENWHDTILALI